MNDVVQSYSSLRIAASAHVASRCEAEFMCCTCAMIEALAQREGTGRPQVATRVAIDESIGVNSLGTPRRRPLSTGSGTVGL